MWNFLPLNSVTKRITIWQMNKWFCEKGHLMSNVKAKHANPSTVGTCWEIREQLKVIICFSESVVFLSALKALIAGIALLPFNHEQFSREIQHTCLKNKIKL